MSVERLKMTPDEVSAVISQMTLAGRAACAYVDGHLEVPTQYAASAREADKTMFLPPVPDRVTALQIRRALRAAGLREKMDDVLDKASDEEVEAFEYASEISRDSEIFSELLKRATGTAKALDDLFRLAAQQER